MCIRSELFIDLYITSKKLLLNIFIYNPTIRSLDICVDLFELLDVCKDSQY